MKRWKLHGNISQKRYGNALIGRYGGCFEERYKEVYDDRAYHAKGLDVPAKVDANSRSKKEAIDVTRLYFSPLIGLPKVEGLRCRVSAISLGEDTKVCLQ